MKNSKKKPLILFVIFLLSVFLPATNKITKDQDLIKQFLAELKPKIDQWFKSNKTPGVAIAVVDQKTTLWQKCLGYTSQDKKQPINSNTLYSIQSMSKSFTALGILKAVNDGLLDLDEPITSYLPNFTVNSIYEKSPQNKMTLRLLLSHKAGFTHEAPLGGNFDCRPHSFEEHVLSISDTWLRYPVNHRYAYSNLGIDLAGYILQVKSGIAFEKYIKTKILMPLGMSESTLDFEKIKTIKNRAIGHNLGRRKIPGGIPVDIPMIPAGGVYTNISDMTKYLQFHLNKGEVEGTQLIKKGLIKEMHSVQIPENKQRSGYGLCIVKSLVSKTYSLFHGGGGYGFITSMTVYPELKIGIVTLTNSGQSQIHGPRIRNILNTMIEKKYGPTQILSQKFTPENIKPIGNSHSKVKEIMGIYDRNTIIGFKNKNFGISFGREFYPLKMYLEKDKLMGKYGQFSEIRFRSSMDKKIKTLITIQKNQGTCSYYDLHKPTYSLALKGPDKPEWQKFLGMYKMLIWGRMSGRVIKVSVRDGFLNINGLRCREYLPGLFIQYDGEVLDFRGTIPTFRNIMLIKRL